MAHKKAERKSRRNTCGEGNVADKEGGGEGALASVGSEENADTVIASATTGDNTDCGSSREQEQVSPAKEPAVPTNEAPEPPSPPSPTLEPTQRPLQNAPPPAPPAQKSAQRERGKPSSRSMVIDPVKADQGARNPAHLVGRTIRVKDSALGKWLSTESRAKSASKTTVITRWSSRLAVAARAARRRFARPQSFRRRSVLCALAQPLHRRAAGIPRGSGIGAVGCHGMGGAPRASCRRHFLAFVGSTPLRRRKLGKWNDGLRVLEEERRWTRSRM